MSGGSASRGSTTPRWRARSEERAAFLAEVCAGDEGLQREVQALVETPATAEGLFRGAGDRDGRTARRRKQGGSVRTRRR